METDTIEQIKIKLRTSPCFEDLLAPARYKGAWGGREGPALTPRRASKRKTGTDPIAERPGFKAMIDRIASNGVRCILVESRPALI